MTAARAHADIRIPKVPESFKHAARKAMHAPVLWLRHRNAERRKVPDFIILGAQKAGTTSLYDYLLQEPRIEAPFPQRDTHFFDLQFHKGVGWYRAHFPLQEGAHIMTGETTPSYLLMPKVAERIASVVPRVKMLVLLRDPVQRAISHYFHEVRRGRERRSLLDAVRAEQQWSEDIRTRLHDRRRLRCFLQQSYMTRGLYADQLESFFIHFPRDHFFIIQSERFFSRPEDTLAQIFAFLQVQAPRMPADMQPRRVGMGKKPVSPSTYAFLQETFREPNRRLFELLGYSYDEWNR